MKSTNLGNVAIANQGVKSSRFPRNHNVYTSCGFGEVQPVKVLHCDADTVSKYSVESKIYLEPIVAPTFGHCKAEFWSYFVEYSDLFDRFKEMFSETPKVTGSAPVVPKKLPWMYRSLLSTLMLWGSFMTVYRVNVGLDGKRTYNTLIVDSSASSSTATTELGSLASRLKYSMQALYNTTSGVSALELTDSQNVFGTYGLHIDARTLVDCPAFVDTSSYGADIYSTAFRIPLANPNMLTLVDYRPSDSFELNIDYQGLDITPVTVKGADVLIERPIVTNVGGEDVTQVFAFAFRLNAFGKRIYKVFKGAEFQEDFYSYDKQVGLMPFFAVFKAYFECFGLLAYDNFESTAVASLLFKFASQGATLASSDFNTGLADSQVVDTAPDYSTFKKFVLDLGSLWVTDSQDFVSAQQPGITNAPRPDSQNLYNELWTMSHAGDTSQEPVAVPSGNDPTQPDVNQHLYIDRVIHGQLDSEVLKKMYQLINTETIAGKRVEQLLRVQGYGEWVDHCKSRFIAHDETAIEFSQVTSLSDTLKDGSGAILGERGGRGEAFVMTRQHSYKNDESGFLVVLLAIVPDAGYTNTLNPAFEALTKYDFYTPVFDGVGEELLEVNKVVGEMPVCCVTKVGDDISVVNESDKSFGYSPRESKWKVTNNIRSGNFALRSVRDSYLPYILDKVIKMGDVVDVETFDSSQMFATTASRNCKCIESIQYFPQSELPLAGLAWRYPTRYPWLGMFTRIFAALGDSVDSGAVIGALRSAAPDLRSYEFLNSELDGFTVLNTIRMNTSEHKLPITDSYETLEEGNGGKIDTNISKA